MAFFFLSFLYSLYFLFFFLFVLIEGVTLFLSAVHWLFFVKKRQNVFFGDFLDENTAVQKVKFLSVTLKICIENRSFFFRQKRQNVTILVYWLFFIHIWIPLKPVSRIRMRMARMRKSYREVKNVLTKTQSKTLMKIIGKSLLKKRENSQ